MNNPSNDRSYWWRISSNDNNEGDFINKGALDSNLGIIYMSADAGKVRAYHNWDDFAPGSQGNYRNIQIRFDANVNNNLNWEFLAPKDEILVQPGVEKIIYYTAKNLSNKTIVGTATYNVSPPKAGSVFMKIDCFCFIEQTLKPGEEVRMPVVFYIDPIIDSDENLKNLNEITLSYTFFKKYEKKVHNKKSNVKSTNLL